MTKLERDINTVLQQIKPKLTAETWELRRQYFNRMLRIAKSLNISEPCQTLYNAFVADDNGSKERKGLHLRCVKLLDEVAGTNARNEYGILYNELALPGNKEVQEYFRDRTYPLADKVSISHLIVKAKMEMQYLELSNSTIGQYLHAWMDIRRYFFDAGTTEYDKQLMQRFLHAIDLKCKNGIMNKWKWKINRKAAHVLIEVADTGRFQWGLIRQSESCAGVEIESIRVQHLTSLKQRNLSKSTISLHDYVFRKAMTAMKVQTQDDLLSLPPEKVQLAIRSFADFCNNRSMGTVIPILRSLLVFLYTNGHTEKDLSGIVMSVFVRRSSVASYISEKNCNKLYAQLDMEPVRTKAIILLALELGLRDCDICNLTFEDIHWHDDKIRIRQTKTGEPLVLSLLPDVGNALMAYILNERPKRRDLYPYIFLREQAPFNKLATVYTICSRFLRRADIQPENGTATGTHLFRYTLVHRLLAAKVPHQVITNALGHVSKEADKPYLSMEESMLRMCALDLSVIGSISWKGAACNG